MTLAECYQTLGLGSGATFEEIKAAYRRLARKYHPDVSSGDQQAKDKFIQITEAYKFLLAQSATSLKQPTRNAETVAKTPPPPQSVSKSAPVKITRKTPPIQFNPELSVAEQHLKASSYQQLQQLLREHRYPRAIALVEGLARRIPQDPEILQWQAIAYQRWGRQLIREKQFEKARLYLKKALRTDPHNRSLWAEIEKDFRQMEQNF